ncbi:glutamyl-tRNA synthetase like protein [Acrodontium crateriforme]|uniref:Glutamate--tRNA ligase, mitochondrial n=1 Tax=Acrodontium crateriforme TaxID=150365 RepID=A0AAQ3R8Q2_9PEZI|nr:glutamyl-tRNA synthetase like protein [Acrodontium crateriforme]
MSSVRTRRHLTSLAAPGTPFISRRRQHAPQLRTLLAVNSSRHYARTEPKQSERKLSRKPLLTDGPVRTRFAPSPTGDLHIGGLRTALFSYLLAKRTGGQFLVRIEDTDQKRLVPGAEERLLATLRWAGLEWDEGPLVGGPYGPYKQSERNDIYQQHAKKILDRGNAYRCFCTPQTAGDNKVAFVTSGCYQDCSHLSAEESNSKADSKSEPFTIRLRQETSSKKRRYPDLVYGHVTPSKRSPSSSSSSAESDSVAADSVLVKSDGTPTYHFANVVDDHLMKITHVIRGSEWMASTPLHYDLYEAFGWDPPAFAHVSLLVDEKGAKLSKRNQEIAMDVNSMRSNYTPEALNNFLVLLGWSNPTRDDVMSMSELIEVFDLKFTKGNTIVNTKKLDYLRKHHIVRRAQKAVSTGSFEPVQELVDEMHSIVLREYPNFALRYKAREEQLDFIANAFLCTSKNFSGTASWVHNHSYLFDFLSKSNHATAETVDFEISEFVAAWLKSFDFQQPYRTPLFISEEPGKVESHIMPESVFQIYRKLQAARDAEMWYQSVGHTQSTLPEGLRKDVPFAENLSVDVKAYIEHLYSIDSHSDEAAAILDRRTAFNTRLLKHLREKLTNVKHGPGVFVIMALLGYKESCRRLGVEPSEKGW